MKSRLFSLEVISVLVGAGMLLVLAVILSVFHKDRVQEFRNYHQSIADSATRKVSSEISESLLRNRQLVQFFMEDNLPLIEALIDDPLDDTLYETLNNRLGRYFLNYFASNISTLESELIIDDFEGLVGQMCVADMKYFIESEIDDQLVRIHPNPAEYHYDILTEFKSHDRNYLFFVSFKTEALATLLSVTSTENHKLMLILPENNLIEINEFGSRNKIPDRDNFFLTENEQLRILARSDIPGTHWQVVDLHSENLFENFNRRRIQSSLVIFLFSTAVIILLSGGLFRLARYNSLYQNDLVKSKDEIEKLNKSLAQQAITDSLTGIYNRRFFDNEIEKEWSKAQRLNLPFSIALIDIDHFKLYNDNYGHQFGDFCIRDIAQLTNQSFRRSNEFVARYGGEEFIVVNMGDPGVVVESNLLNLLHAVKQKNLIHTTSPTAKHVTVSIGLACIEKPGEISVFEFIREADQALYQAKKNGRNRLEISDLSTTSSKHQ